MKKAKVFYLLNEEGRKKSILAGGDGKELQVLDTDITEELLNLSSVDTDGNVWLTVGFTNYSYTDYCKDQYIYAGSNAIKEVKAVIDTSLSPKPYIKTVSAILRFDDVQTVEELIAFQKSIPQKYKESLESIQSEYEQQLKEYEQQEAIRLEARKLEKAAKDEARRLEEEKKEKEKKEMLEWIESYGSDYLKNVTTLGYDFKKQYIKERANKDFPGFELDLDTEYEWEYITTLPSEDATIQVMDLIEKGADAEIVLITSDGDYKYEFEETEAIIVHFNGYTLIKSLS